MNILDSILKSWHDTQDVEHLISSNAFANQLAIQSELDALDPPTRTKTLKELEEIQVAIEHYIMGLDNEKSDMKRQMESMQKSQKACLSYGASIGIEDKSKR